MDASNFFRRFAAVIFGLVFLIGGFLKISDPVGSELVMRSYLSFLRLGFMLGLAPVLACIFNLAECFVGAAMISGVWRRPVKWISLAMMAFFTLLTLLLLIFNPAMDCGCFGEALHLSHLQSFLKNIALLALWAAAFVRPGSAFSVPKRRHALTGLVLAFLAIFAFVHYRTLPLLDLTDLKIGTELEEGRISLLDESGNYDEELLLDGDIFVVSVYNSSKLRDEADDQISSLYRAARKVGARVIIVGPVIDDKVDYSTDLKKIYSLNRVNGGVTYISSGQIVKKWPSADISEEEIASVTGADGIIMVADQTAASRRSFRLIALVMGVCLLI